MSAWLEHVAKWRDCQLCPLHQQRSNIVLARGTIPCDVLFVGEAPGASEDALGLPFVGPAGKLLDSDEEKRPGIVQKAIPCHLEWSEAKRCQVWILDVLCAFTNLVACFPLEAKLSGDHEPAHAEILKCRPRLEEFIELAQPRLLVTVGDLAEGYVRELGGLRVHITHPAAILRMPMAQKGFAVQKQIVVLRYAVENMLQLGK